MWNTTNRDKATERNRKKQIERQKQKKTEGNRGETEREKNIQGEIKRVPEKRRKMQRDRGKERQGKERDRGRE